MLNTEVVRAAFTAYLTQDERTAAQLLAEDFVFTSPQDDHIDKAAYLERCFPTADRLVSQEILELVGTDGDGVFILYEYELKTDARHRNTEFITVRPRDRARHRRGRDAGRRAPGLARRPERDGDRG